MGWKKVEGDPFAQPVDPVAAPAVAPAAPPEEEPIDDRSVFGVVSDIFTGNDRTEHPDMPEFAEAYRYQKPEEAPGQRSMWNAFPRDPGAGAIKGSTVTPDPEAQYDILKKAIPGLERKPDAHGNIMLKAPGMTDFAYLNKPGVSKRDMDEFATQAVITAPTMTPAGRAVSTLGRVVKGGLGMAGGSVLQDAAAVGQGSEQGIDPERAALSGTLGAALPAAGSVLRGVGGGVMSVVRGVADQVQGATNPADVGKRVVQRAFNRDKAAGFNPERSVDKADMPSVAKFGQDMRTMDFGGENVAGEARKAANFSASARDELMRVIDPRYEGQANRLESWFGNLGLGNSSMQIRSQLKEQARKARTPLYTQAYRMGKDGVDTALLKQLQTSPVFQRAMGAAELRVADNAATPGWVSFGVKGKNGYTLEYWDQVKQVLDDYAGEAFRTGANSRGAQLSMMAKALRDELDAQGPMGKFYQQARGTAMRFFKADDALEAGENFAKSDYNLQDAMAAIGNLNPAEKKLFTEGFADMFVRKVRKSTDRSNLLNRIAASTQERDRLNLALGSGRYQQLDTFLRLEGIMQKMKDAMGNSTTARQWTDLAKGYGIQGIGGATGAYGVATGDPTTAIIGAIMAGGRQAQLKINENVAEEIAKLLTSKDPDVFLHGLQQLGKQPISDAIRAFDNMLASTGMATPIAAQGLVNANSYQPEPPREGQ